MNTTRAQRLASVPLLRALPPDRLEHIITRCMLRRFPRGSFLLEQGCPTSELFLIDRGRVALARLPEHGRQGILALVGPGDVIGEAALLGLPHSHAASAIEDVVAIAIPVRELSPYLTTQPAVALAAAAMFAERTRELEQIATDLLLLDAPGRLASRLCDLADRHGRTSPDGPTLPRSISHEHLAGLVGVSRETITRVIGTFRSAGWLSRQPGAPTITDQPALRARAEA